MTVLALYVAYALLTLPDDGGLDAGSHSAITFNASDDKLFATRGVFKGEELQAADTTALCPSSCCNRGPPFLSTLRN